MSEISRDDVLSIFSGLSDATVANIIATGATPAELLSARDWIVSDAAHTNPNHKLPLGAMSHVVEIVERATGSGAGKSAFGNAGSTLE